MGRDPAGPVAIVAALREELASIESRLEGARRVRWGRGKYSSGQLAGRPAVLLRTGVGPTRAFRVTTAFLEEVPAAALLATGFAGALSEALRPGDLLAASGVQSLGERPEARGSGTHLPAPQLAERLRAAVPGLYWGRLVTVARVISRAREKRALGRVAEAADMETAEVARAAEAAGVPALFVRAILDETALELSPGIERLLGAGGRPRLSALAALLVRRPGAVRILWALRKRQRHAARRLGAFVERALAAGVFDEETGGSPGKSARP